MDNIAVLTCHKDLDLLPAVLGSIEKAWTRPHRLLVSSVAQGQPMGEQLIRTLRHCFPEPVVILMGDYFLEEIQEDLVEQAFQTVRSSKFNYVRLDPCPPPREEDRGAVSGLMPGFGRFRKADPYFVSLRPAIWNSGCDFSIWPEWSPWDIEIQGSKGATHLACGTYERAVKFHELSVKGRRI